MSKLYIANASTQHQGFSYRVPDEAPGGGIRLGKNRTQIIPPGKQLPMAGDLTTAQIDAIIDQHRKYGALEVSEIGKQTAYCHLIASADRPVTSARLLEVMRKNILILREKGKRMREMAAISAHEEQIKHFMEDDAPTLVKMELEVEEQRDRFSTATEDRHEEHLRVSEDIAPGPAPRRAPAKGRQPRKKAA